MAYDIEQLLINEANRIGPDIYRKTLNTSPWLKLIKKDTWPDEMGQSINVLTYERSLPINSLAWSSSSTSGSGSLSNWSGVTLDPVSSSAYQTAVAAAATAYTSATAGSPTAATVLAAKTAYDTAITAANALYNNGTSAAGSANPGPGTAVPTAQIVNFAQTLRSYNLTQTAIQSPAISVNDLRFSLKRKEQLSNIFDILSENTSYAWQDRFRDEYVRLSQNKIVANVTSTGALVSFTGENAVFADVASLTGGSSSATLAQLGYVPPVGSNAPASILTQGILDRVYMKLIRDGAGTNALDRENSRPVFGIICSSETSRNLIHDNPDIRQDYRWSSKVNELLTPLGIERSYAGFFHMVDDWGPRYNLVTPITGTTTGGGAFVRVYPYKMVATTQGYKWDINPAYESATYEDTIVFHQDVFQNLVPKPITSVGAASFDAVSYMGEFKWRNIPHRDDNPDGNIGFFRAVLSAGSKPIRPEWGYVIRHLRASTPLGLLNTSTAAQNISGYIDETKDYANV